MKIIVVGCGKVGQALTEQLNREHHDLTVLDINPTVVQEISNKLDVMGVIGNGASYSVLVEAGVEDADLFIAMTGSDELNLLCCIIANKAGNCDTIARIRNPLFSNDINQMRHKLGLAMVINPEQASARDIAHILKFPSALKVETFAKGKIEIIMYKIEKGSKLHGLMLSEISTKLKCDVLICAVQRGDKVIIPDGSFVLNETDTISLIASRKNFQQFFKHLNIATTRIKNAIIVGGSQISYYLTKELLDLGIHVKIIERDKARCETLSSVLPDADIICGDGTNRNLLMEEGLLSADSFASLTNLDEENIMLSLFVKSQCKAKLITKINRITFDEVVEQLDLGTILNPKNVTAEHILTYVRAKQNSIGSDVETLYRLIEDKVEALEFHISKESPIVNIPLEQLKIRKNILVCCINRQGLIITPKGKDTIKVGDTVIIVTTLTGLNNIRDIFER